MIARLAVKRGEEGSALVLALAFLSLFGVYIGMVLGQAQTSALATIASRVVEDRQYGIDGAMDAAINNLRGNMEMGREFLGGSSAPTIAGPCPRVSTSAVNAQTVEVTCAGLAGSGTASDGTDNPSNKPKRAVLSLTTGPSETGLFHSSATGLKIHGSVFSQTNVDNSSGQTLTIEGDLSSPDVCTGTIVSTFPPPHCSNTGGGASSGTDPAYLGAISAPADATLPTCGAGSTISFPPGAYRDAVALNALFNGSCANKVFHFTPGTFYFEFTGATKVWTINDATADLVGGTLSGSSAFPGRCSTPGVQFVFGADSQLVFSAGEVELCPTYSAGAQQIAIYGLKTSTAGGSTSVRLTPTTATQTAGSWTNPNNATGDIDGSNATCDGNNPTKCARFSSGSPNTATMTLGGYGVIPTGATVTAVTLGFSHRDKTKVASVAVVLTPGDGSGSCASIPGTVSNNIHTNSTDVLSCLSTPAKTNGVTAAYSTTETGNTQDAFLDAAVLDVTYTSPGTNAQSGCVIVKPYPSSGCAMLKTTGGSLAVQGTIYAPLAAVDLTLTGVNYSVVGRGIIARVFRSGIAIAGGYTGAPVNLPDDCPRVSPSCATAGTRTDRSVQLVATLGGVQKLVARVGFADCPGGACSAVPTATVTAWSVIR